MQTDMLPYILVILLSVFVASVSQVLLKKAAMQHYDSVLKEYLNPRVMVAYALFFGTTLLTLVAYRGIPLSLGPVLETTAYFYVTFFGVRIFGEKLTGKKVVALLMIVGGIVLYALG